MAEVQKLATSDIPICSSNVENTADAANAVDLGASPPTQERSSNSHPHDSEYDTASDLEGDTSEVDDGGEEYDEDDTDLDDETDDDDDIENEEREPLSGDGAESADKTGEAETQKKVDEDRSNPQYIPKRGTFYEHDDRMADGENDVVLQIGDIQSGVENVAKGGPKAASHQQSPSISHASKTMKKFQPASASERWTHDRFDPSEQQPKSDAEIINQYGFNMRKESKPPRARKCRRYARGPNKYDRKWEDESAYIKPSNKERKPPRASDFPALNERSARKPRRGSRDLDDDRDRRDEKENRPERRRTVGGAVGVSDNPRKSSVNERLNVNAPRTNYNDERRDREDNRNRSVGKSSVQSRLNAGSGRQPAMEFKQKNRNIRPSTSSQQNSHSQQSNGRSVERFDGPNQRYSQNQSNYSVAGDDQDQQNRAIKSVSHAKPNDVYKNNNTNTNSGNSASNQAQIPTKIHEQHGYGQLQQQHQLPTQMQQSQQQQPSQQQNMMQIRQSMSVKTAPTPSNLSQRLQQVQNRNDPSHVGSVQMHSLATQNQQLQHQQQLVLGQQTSGNTMMISQQQQQQLNAQPQEQRGPPKRYSSMRRSQHDPPHLPPDAHSHQQQQLQQLHMQQPPPPPQTTPGAPGMMMQDQHSLLQANLLQQLYHQENLQAQMQALQVSQSAPAPQPKQPSIYGGNPTNTAAYYVADAYGATTPNTQAPPAAAATYATQQPTYLPPTPANAATMAYAAQPQPAPNPIPGGPPSTVYAGPPQPAANTNQNFSNYQNYNTVGGTTYFVPPAPTTSRPVVLPQRRPTNAIPILPPAEKNKHRSNETSKEDISKMIPQTQMDTGENIDHIIDNMFVQRPAFQPPQPSMTTSQAAVVQAVAENTSPAGDAHTQAAGMDSNTCPNNAPPNIGSKLPESANNSSSSNAPTIAEVASVTNSNLSEISSNNNTNSPQE